VAFCITGGSGSVLVGDDLLDGGVHVRMILIAMFFPIESPWFDWRDREARRWRRAFTATINFIEHLKGEGRGRSFGARRGANGGSSGALKFRRWLFWVNAAGVSFLMCVSTIWGRYPLCAEFLVGMTTGDAGYVMAIRIMKEGRGGDGCTRECEGQVAS